MQIDRRDFLKITPAAALLFSFTPVQVLGRDNTRLSVRGNRSTDIEGQWKLTDIEGEIPKELRGSFYKIGPATKEIFGTKLKRVSAGTSFKI